MAIVITVKFIKPFYKRVSGTKLQLVFSYQYFSILKDDEVFHFVPIEGKEMIFDLTTMQVENLSEVFVFQRGSRFIRLPVYQLMIISNVHEYLKPILEDVTIRNDESKTATNNTVNKIEPEVIKLLETLEQMNIQYAIDKSLKDRDETMFYKIIEMESQQEGEMLNE